MENKNVCTWEDREQECVQMGGWRTRMCADGRIENKNMCRQGGWRTRVCADGKMENKNMCKNSRKMEEEDKEQKKNVYRWGTRT
jgi:hypothetical protein